MSGNGWPGRNRKTIEQHLAVLLRNGIPLHRAAPAVGTSETAVNRWLARARQGDDAYARFADTVDAARAERAHDEAQLLADARQATTGRQ